MSLGIEYIIIRVISHTFGYVSVLAILFVFSCAKLNLCMCVSLCGFVVGFLVTGRMMYEV